MQESTKNSITFLETNKASVISKIVYLKQTIIFIVKRREELSQAVLNGFSDDDLKAVIRYVDLQFTSANEEMINLTNGLDALNLRIRELQLKAIEND